MKKGLLVSYVTGITDEVYGEKYKKIFSYFFPEFVSALLLYSVPFWLDAAFVSQLKSTTTYATLGATNNLIHFIIKVAEAFSVGTVILSGQLNGSGQYQQAGRAARDAFWVTFLLGSIMASFLYVGAPWIYHWYGVSKEVAVQGVPFLRLRAVGVLFTFVYFAFVGFLRGIKNTKTPMQIFMLGVTLFVICDYILIFGKFGFPAMGLQGSALASVIQYCVMVSTAFCYIVFSKKNRRYAISLFAPIKDGAYAKHLLMLSWPVVLDKAILAAAYIWLLKMICPMGTSAVATFCVVKDMERFAFLPAIAAAQVITFLVSNDIMQDKRESIKNNIKKVVFLASIFVFFILISFSLWPTNVIQFFDKKGDFTVMASRVFPLLSVLVFFDLLQLILSGALRGAGEVKRVMMIRLIICFGYFVPASYIISQMHFQDPVVKFVLIYGSFYVGSALMSIAYINRFRSEKWETHSTEGHE